MTFKQTVALWILGGGMLYLVLHLIRQGSFREKYALLWVGICLAFLSVPPLFDQYVAMGRFIGIIAPNSFFFFLAIIALFLLSLQFTLALTTAFHQRKTNAQHLALLDERLRRLEQEVALLKQGVAEKGSAGPSKTARRPAATEAEAEPAPEAADAARPMENPPQRLRPESSP